MSDIQDDFNVASMMANRDLSGDEVATVVFYKGQRLDAYTHAELCEIIIDQARQIEGFEMRLHVLALRNIERWAASQL